MAALNILVNFTSSHLCEVMQQQLGLSGMCITIMPHGADVRAAVEETNPDIVLIDWPSGGHSTIDFCRSLRQFRSNYDLPLIVIAAHDNGADPVLALDEGADDCIVQPFSSRELFARISAILRGARLSVPYPITNRPDFTPVAAH